MTGRVAIYALPGTASPGNETFDATADLLRERAEKWIGRRLAGGVLAGTGGAGAALADACLANSNGTAAAAGDADSAAAPDPFVIDDWNRAELDGITVDARRYGFHGTLKAPFRLRDGCTIDQLQHQLTRFAAPRQAVVIPQLKLSRIGEFFALVPVETPPELHSLAESIVVAFDEFRAPMTDAEFARRNPAALTQRGRELLKSLGYPYVLDEFRFHLTLTDRVPAAQQARVQHSLERWFAHCVARPVAIDVLGLLTESEPGAPFQLHSLHPLSAHSPTDGNHEGTL